MTQTQQAPASRFVRQCYKLLVGSLLLLLGACSDDQGQFCFFQPSFTLDNSTKVVSKVVMQEYPISANYINTGLEVRAGDDLNLAISGMLHFCSDQDVGYSCSDNEDINCVLAEDIATLGWSTIPSSCYSTDGIALGKTFALRPDTNSLYNTNINATDGSFISVTLGDPNQPSECAVDSNFKDTDGTVKVNQIDDIQDYLYYEDNDNTIRYSRFGPRLSLRVGSANKGILDDTFIKSGDVRYQGDGSGNGYPANMTFDFLTSTSGGISFQKPAFSHTKQGGQLLFLKKNHCASINGDGFRNTNYGQVQYAVVSKKFLAEYSDSSQLLGVREGNTSDPGPTINWTDINSTVSSNGSLSEVAGTDYTLSNDGVLIFRLIKPGIIDNNNPPAVMQNEAHYKGSYMIRIDGTFVSKPSWEKMIGNGGSAVLPTYTNYAETTITKISNGISDLTVSQATKLYLTIKYMTQYTAYQMFQGLLVNSNFISYVMFTMILYIVYMSYRFIMGLEQMALKDFGIKLLKLAFILALISEDGFWFFEMVMFDAVYNFFEVLIGVLNGSDGGGHAELFLPLTHAWDAFTGWDTWARMLSLLVVPPYFGWWSGILLIKMFLYVFLRYLVTCGKVFISVCIAVVILGLLLSVGPLFVTFLMFKETSEFFKKWYQLIFRYTLEPALLLIGTSIIGMMSSVVLYMALSTPVCWKCFYNIDIGGVFPICVPWFVPFHMNEEPVMSHGDAYKVSDSGNKFFEVRDNSNFTNTSGSAFDNITSVLGLDYIYIKLMLALLLWLFAEMLDQYQSMALRFAQMISGSHAASGGGLAGATNSVVDMIKNFGARMAMTPVGVELRTRGGQAYRAVDNYLNGQRGGVPGSGLGPGGGGAGGGGGGGAGGAGGSGASGGGSASGGGGAGGSGAASSNTGNNTSGSGTQNPNSNNSQNSNTTGSNNSNQPGAKTSSPPSGGSSNAIASLNTPDAELKAADTPLDLHSTSPTDRGGINHNNMNSKLPTGSENKANASNQAATGTDNTTTAEPTHTTRPGLPEGFGTPTPDAKINLSNQANVMGSAGDPLNASLTPAAAARMRDAEENRGKDKTQASDLEQPSAPEPATTKTVERTNDTKTAPDVVPPAPEVVKVPPQPAETNKPTADQRKDIERDVPEIPPTPELPSSPLQPVKTEQAGVDRGLGDNTLAKDQSPIDPANPAPKNTENTGDLGLSPEAAKAEFERITGKGKTESVEEGTDRSANIADGSTITSNTISSEAGAGEQPTPTSSTTQQQPVEAAMEQQQETLAQAEKLGGILSGDNQVVEPVAPADRAADIHPTSTDTTTAAPETNQPPAPIDAAQPPSTPIESSESVDAGELPPAPEDSVTPPAEPPATPEILSPPTDSENPTNEAQVDQQQQIAAALADQQATLDRAEKLSGMLSGETPDNQTPGPADRAAETPPPAPIDGAAPVDPSAIADDTQTTMIDTGKVSLQDVMQTQQLGDQGLSPTKAAGLRDAKDEDTTSHPQSEADVIAQAQAQAQELARLQQQNEAIAAAQEQKYGNTDPTPTVTTEAPSRHTDTVGSAPPAPAEPAKPPAPPVTANTPPAPAQSQTPPTPPSSDALVSHDGNTQRQDVWSMPDKEQQDIALIDIIVADYKVFNEGGGLDQADLASDFKRLTDLEVKLTANFGGNVSIEQLKAALTAINDYNQQQQAFIGNLTNKLYRTNNHDIDSAPIKQQIKKKVAGAIKDVNKDNAALQQAISHLDKAINNYKTANPAATTELEAQFKQAQEHAGLTKLVGDS